MSCVVYYLLSIYYPLGSCSFPTETQTSIFGTKLREQVSCMAARVQLLQQDAYRRHAIIDS